MQAFARHDLHQPEVISLGRELVEWRESFQQVLGSHCRMEYKGEGKAWVLVDRLQIEQILRHLLKNAREASPPGAIVELRLSRQQRSAAEALGSPLDAGSQVLVEVVDFGRGMTAAVKARLFEPFFTTKPVGQGTGLSLAAVHGLVTQNGGAVEVESAVQQGTTVRLFFPEVVGENRTASGSPLPRAVPGLRHLLLVDDDATACRTVTFALEQAGYEVTVVDSGFKAVQFIRQASPKIQMAIVSASLPLMAGRELGERLQKHTPGLPVLYVCGRFDVPPDWPADTARFPLLLKPFRPADLIQRIGEMHPASPS
jgi:CheY-like chemotaxis protein